MTVEVTVIFRLEAGKLLALGVFEDGYNAPGQFSHVGQHSTTTILIGVDVVDADDLAVFENVKGLAEGSGKESAVAAWSWVALCAQLGGKLTHQSQSIGLGDGPIGFGDGGHWILLGRLGVDRFPFRLLYPTGSETVSTAVSAEIRYTNGSAGQIRFYKGWLIC